MHPPASVKLEITVEAIELPRHQLQESGSPVASPFRFQIEGRIIAAGASHDVQSADASG